MAAGRRTSDAQKAQFLEVLRKTGIVKRAAAEAIPCTFPAEQRFPAQRRVLRLQARPVVVGSSHSEDGPEAFRWTEEGGFQRLGDLPGGNFASRAMDVSADGSIVVGESYSELSQPVGWTEAFVWTESAGMVGLGDLPGGVFRSSALAISEDGSTVVGASSSDLGFPGGVEAFVWTEATGMVGLGFLGNDDSASVASATSGDGQIVGGSASRFDGPRGISVQLASNRAFIWDRFTGMRNLQAVLTDLGLDLEGWTLEGVGGISEDGLVIVGRGINPAGNTEAWIADLGEPTITADINIWPWSDANSNNPASRGVILCRPSRIRDLRRRGRRRYDSCLQP